MNRVQLFENIVVMALADGGISRDEFNLLSDRCQEWGIEDYQFREAIDRASSPNASFYIPEDPQARRNLLREVIRMMGADGRLSEGEKQLFSVVAAAMRISTEELDGIIDSVVNEVE